MKNINTILTFVLFFKTKYQWKMFENIDAHNKKKSIKYKRFLMKSD